jgi:nucleolar protein 53
VVPHEGQSYNPPAAAHDELLTSAGAAAVRAEEVRLKDAAYKKGWKAGAEVAAFDEGGQRVRGMLVGAGDAEAMESADEDAEEEVPELSEDEDAEPKNTDPKRKTKAQRARAARVKAEVRAGQTTQRLPLL